jgi:predicted small lipoprotein YifL
MKYLLLILALAGCGDGGGLLDDPANVEAKPEHVQTLTPEKS